MGKICLRSRGKKSQYVAIIVSTEALNNGLFVSECLCFFGIESSPFFPFLLFCSFSFYFDIRYFIYASIRFIGRLRVPMYTHTNKHTEFSATKKWCCVYGAIAIVSIVAGKSLQRVQKKKECAHAHLFGYDDTVCA